MAYIDTLYAGSHFRNDNGDVYIVVAINKDKDRVLLMTNHKNKPFYVGAWGIREGSWAQGHYFMDNFEAAANYVNGKEVD